MSTLIPVMTQQGLETIGSTKVTIAPAMSLELDSR